MIPEYISEIIEYKPIHRLGKDTICSFLNCDKYLESNNYVTKIVIRIFNNNTNNGAKTYYDYNKFLCLSHSPYVVCSRCEDKMTEQNDIDCIEANNICWTCLQWANM